MRLAPFDLMHADVVAGWAATPADLDRWASLREAPTAETFAAWMAEPGCSAFLLCADRPVAYGELWLSRPEDEVELARLLVAPDARGRGVGRALVSLLVEEARALSVSTAWVRVVPENEPALRCYAAAGFARAPADMEAAFNAAQPRTYRWLRRGL
jgi:GNAT superfamily N-acetyltransferase